MDITVTRCCGPALGIHLPSMASLMTEGNITESMLRDAVAEVNGHGKKVNLARPGGGIALQKNGPHVRVAALEGLADFNRFHKRELINNYLISPAHPPHLFTKCTG